MTTKTLFVLLALLLPALAQAKPIERQLLAGEAVASTGTVTSSAVKLADFDGLTAIWVQCTSVSGVADVKIERIDSIDNSTFTDVADQTVLLASTLAEFTTAPEGPNPILSPVFFGKYAKFILTGVGSNPADTLCDLFVVGPRALK